MIGDFFVDDTKEHEHHHVCTHSHKNDYQKKIDAYNKLSLNEKNENIVKSIIGDQDFNDNIIFKRVKSFASCDISDIEGFVFGGFSSRFWTYRKHINSMPPQDLKKV